MAIAGQRLSHFDLVEKIGEGGMGVVWRAFDHQLEREVALKMLPESREAHPERVARIVDEAKAVAALNHPNIVTIHSIDQTEERVFFVMELVKGRTLDELIPEGGFPLARFFELAIALADAVGTAHDRGVTHRDLKPGNIMLCADGSPKILDFGLAKANDPGAVEDADPDSTQTMPSGGRLAGTIPYMSPEQVRGEPLDHRSDLFSLSVVLYELATGRLPFYGGTPAEIIASILRDAPPSVNRLRRGLPRHLGRILRHALQKEPRSRFQTSHDLRNELAQLREEIRGQDNASNVRSVAVLPLDDLSRDAGEDYFVDGMTDALINSLGRIGALKVISRTSVMQYKGKRVPVPEIARELGVDAVIEGSVLRADGRVRITAQLVDAIRDRMLWAESFEHDLSDVLALQGAVAKSIAERIEIELTPQEDTNLKQTQPIDPAAHEAYLKGRHFWYKRTTESVRRGLAYFEEAARLAPKYAPAHTGIADSNIVDGGRYLGVTPEVAYARARAAAKAALSLDDQLAESHTSLAAVMTDYDWDWEGADREYRRAIELNPSYATAHSWYAEQLSRMGKHDEAIAEARRARELDPLSLVSSMVVAWILYFARRFDEAIEQAQRTLELEPNYATAQRILGWSYEETGNYEAAITCHLRAAQLTDHEPNFTAQLARPHALAGKTAEARKLLADLIRISRDRYVSSLDVATIYASLGEPDHAFEWLDRALDEHADHLPYSKVNPRLDPLRGDPRFEALLERMGLS